jgi:hypothetical protein
VERSRQAPSTATTNCRQIQQWTRDLPARVKVHLDGHGARLMEVIKEAGITWHVARTWTGTRDLERAIKDQHAAPKLCPECSPHPRPLGRGRVAAAQPRPQASMEGRPKPVRAARPQALPSPAAVPAAERGAAQARVRIGQLADAGLAADDIVAVEQRVWRDYDPDSLPFPDGQLSVAHCCSLYSLSRPRLMIVF